MLAATAAGGVVLAVSSGLTEGGHFAAWEQPQLFTEELRAAFKPFRNA